MECPSCYYVAAPGEAAHEGACPNCQRPYRGQPSPTQSDMTLRDMPQDGASDDMGGNPLREGILGDYDNRAKRDESFASVQSRETPYAPLWYASSEMKPEAEIPADLVDVIPKEDLPKKRKDRDLDSIESSTKESGLWGALIGGGIGAFAGGPWGAVQGASIGNNIGNAAGSLMNHAMGGGGGGQPQQQMAPAVEDPSFYSHTSGSPSEDFAPNMNKIPDAEDSQDGDTKQHDDGDRSKGEQVGDGVNDIGGTDQGNNDFGGFSEDSIGRLLTLLPLLVHHGESGTGHDDPLVHALDQMLEGEVPGYKDTHNDPEAHQHIVMMIKKGPDKGDSMHTDDNEAVATDPKQDAESIHASVHQSLQQPGLVNNPAQTNMRPNDAAMGNHCPMCGGTLDPTNPTCPQCGAPNSRAHGMGMGGNMPIQAALDPDYLRQFGPGDYGAVYRQFGPEGLKQHLYLDYPDIPPDMTIKDWNANGRPDDRCQHCVGTGCELCGGTGKRVSSIHLADGQGPQTDDQKAMMAQALQDQGRGDEVPQMIINPAQYAREFASLIGKEAPPQIEGGQPPAPPVAPPPDPSQMGGMGGAGPMAAPNPQMAMSRAIQRYAEKDHIQQHGDNFDNSVDVPAADQIGQFDPEQDQDASHHWADEDGNPLKVGQEYEMYSQNYDIPDLIRVDAVKPDSIEFTLTGEYGLDHRTSVSWEEAQMESYSFQNANAAHGDELGGADPYNAEDNMDDPNRTAPGEQSDLSTPHQMAYSSIEHEASPFLLFEQGGQPCPQCGQPTQQSEASGLSWCPNCRIEVPHTTAPAAPVTPNPSRVPPSQAETYDRTASERDWLMKDAGAHFTPHEQREFIEEAGVARNADRLDLRGTHYESGSRDVEIDSDYFLFGV